VPNKFSPKGVRSRLRVISKTEYYTLRSELHSKIDKKVTPGKVERDKMDGEGLEKRKGSG